MISSWFNVAFPCTVQYSAALNNRPCPPPHTKEPFVGRLPNILLISLGSIWRPPFFVSTSITSARMYCTTVK